MSLAFYKLILLSQIMKSDPEDADELLDKSVPAQLLGVAVCLGMRGVQRKIW